MKRRRNHTALSQEDHVLWKRVAETVSPLRATSSLTSDQLHRELEEYLGEPAPPTISRGPKPATYQTPAPAVHRPKLPGHPVAHPIEERTIKKLAKGRQPIDSRIDLHGMSRDRARFALLDYLQMAQQSDHRIVLVITGKGNEGTGVLRSNVPKWLELPEFSRLTNGYRISHASHGGDGALYVRIRKPRSQRH